MRITAGVMFLLAALALAPVWAEDDGAPPPQPVVEQPQAPTEWHANLGEGEKVFSSQEAADAYGRSRGWEPTPGFQEGVFDKGGRFLGKNQAEADANTAAEQAAERAKNPPNPFAGTPDEQHNYYDPQKKQWSGLFMVNGRAVTPQEYEAESHAKREAFLDGGRKAIRDAKAGHGKKGKHDQDIEQDALDATEAQHEKTEKDMAEDEKKMHEEMTRLVPSRTLRSYESNGGGGEQK